MGAMMLTVTEALKQRISTRQFLPQGLAASLVREILDVARWAPSGGNLQPWRVIAVAGKEREAVIKLAQNQHASGIVDASEGRPVYPPNLWEPYRSRRFKIGEDMYALLGIPRTDRAARLRRWSGNYEFFGAPVGLFFVIDERMGHGQWAHLGMFMLSIALAAWERGVSSCMQEAWAVMRPMLKSHFELAATDMIYCGMALGYADPAAPVNRLRSERLAVDEFATLRGFD
jgi:nitroreductase